MKGTSTLQYYNILQYTRFGLVAANSTEFRQYFNVWIVTVNSTKFQQYYNIYIVILISQELEVGAHPMGSARSPGRQGRREGRLQGAVVRPNGGN